MGLLGSAVLVNWGGIVEEKEIEYNEWHSKEHMPEDIFTWIFKRFESSWNSRHKFKSQIFYDV